MESAQNVTMHAKHVLIIIFAPHTKTTLKGMILILRGQSVLTIYYQEIGNTILRQKNALNAYRDVGGVL